MVWLKVIVSYHKSRSCTKHLFWLCYLKKGRLLWASRCQLLMNPDWLDVYLLLSLGSSERSLSERTVHFLCYMVKTDFGKKCVGRMWRLQVEGLRCWTLPLRAVYSRRWKCARLRRVDKSSGGTDAEGWVRLSCCFGDNPREKRLPGPFQV